MNIRQFYLLTLTLSLIFASVLVWASQKKYRFYEDLLKTCENVIQKAEKLTPIEIQEDKFEIERQKLIKDDYVRIIILSEYLYKKEIKYYNDKKLIAIDKLDESEKLLRRDIFDTEGNVRIQIFYGQDEEKLRMYYVNLEGERINTIKFRLPYFYPWRPY
jgi:hypothetical protein